MREILIVDDNPSNLDLLARLLRDAGYKVRAVTGGRRALDSATLAPPELVLLDITMPEMDGYEVCRAFKEDPRLSPIPIIFISALDDPLDKVKAFSIGGADYITKPFQMEEVLARVRHQLALSQLRADLEQRNQNLEKAMATLQRLDEEKNYLMGVVAHDLRNPLTGIVLAANLILEEDGLELIRLQAHRIAQAGNEMVGLVSRLLDMAAIESGALKPTPGVFDLGAAAREVIDRNRGWAATKQLEIVERLPASPVQVVADVRFLKEILDNLIANAVKFSPPGRQVTVSCASESGWIHCSVADQGPGFTEEDRTRLYARFVRLSASPTAGEKSTGLGLSIVKQMIDAMNGEVRVDSELARGSVFHVQLPCGMGQLT